MCLWKPCFGLFWLVCTSTQHTMSHMECGMSHHAVLYTAVLRYVLQHYSREQLCCTQLC
jgi:hypothetical protein